MALSKEDMEKLDRSLRSKFRFGVQTEDDRYSREWRTISRGDDFYVAPAGGADSKISLHASGQCQYGLTGEFFRSLTDTQRARMPDRAFETWQRPKTPERGALHVLSLLFPTDFLRGPKLTGRAGKTLILFAAAPPGKALEFGIFYHREHPTALEDRFAKLGSPLLHTALRSGEFVSIVARVTPFDGTPLRKQMHIPVTAMKSPSDLRKLERGQIVSNLTVLVALPLTSDARTFAEITGVTMRKNF